MSWSSAAGRDARARSRRASSAPRAGRSRTRRPLAADRRPAIDPRRRPAPTRGSRTGSPRRVRDASTGARPHRWPRRSRPRRRRSSGAIVLVAPHGSRWPRVDRGGSSTGAAIEASARSSRALLASGGRGARLDRRADRPPEPPLLRRVRAPSSPIAAGPSDAVGVLMIDIDRFKGSTTRYGHATGDQVLRAVAGAIAGGGPRGRRPGALRRRGIRRPAAQPDPRSRSRSASGSAARSARSTCAGSASRRSACRSAWPSPTARRADRRRSIETGRPGPLPGQARGPRPGRRRVDVRRPAAVAPRTIGRAADRRRDRARRRSPTHEPSRSIADADARRRDRLADERRRDLTNGDLARIFHEIGDMLEVKGELVFKTVAYHRAADAIGRSPVDLVGRLPSRQPAAHPGRRARRSATRSPSSRRPAGCAFYEQLRAEVPPCLVEMLADPGPRPEDRPPDPRASSGSRRSTTSGRPPRPAGSARLKGLSGRTEQLDPRRDRPRSTQPPGPAAPPPGRGAHRRRSSSSSRHARRRARSSLPARSAGGARRSATSTCWPRPTDPAAPDGRVRRRSASSIASSTGAATRRRSGLLRGPQVDLMVMPPGEAGTYRIHFTGHQGAQRPAAGPRPRPRLEPVREGLPADRRGRRAADRRRRRAADVRDRGRGVRVPRPAVHRAGAARGPRRDRGGPGRARCPPSSRSADLRGDLHSHSDWSDGVHSIEVMAEAARRRGHAYQVLTDHSSRWRSPAA